MQSEKSIEAYLVRKVKEAGGRAYKFTSPSRRGVPDRIILMPGGRALFVEVKKPGGKLSPLQQKEIRDLRLFGHSVSVVDCKDDVDFFIKLLK